jgi:7,8-dihydropterin-6-yl-methyl-4-(beta-D-ribofuranosyl)aminobenzene 5'-phosphate synthase
MKRRNFIKSIVISTGGAIMIKNHDVSGNDIDQNSILVKMIYNNTGNNSNFRKDWGLAMWIEENNNAVFFDTGGNPKIFWKNIQAAGIDVSKLSVIIISHNHLDHTLGIPIILEKTGYKPVIYVPAADVEDFRSKYNRATIKPVHNAQHITGSIWSTGEMKASLNNDAISEQSIIILQGKMAYIFTGCAHQGIIAIVEKTKSLHPDKDIALLAGGFHLLDHTIEQLRDISEKLNTLEVKKIAPSHCTGDKAIAFFRSEWKERFIDFNIGDDFKI